MITLLFMIVPFYLLTIWYVFEKQEKTNILDRFVSDVRSCCVGEPPDNIEEIVQYNVEYLNAIYDMFKFVFKVVTTVITIALTVAFVLRPEAIDIRVKLITLFLFLTMCLANFVYGYSRNSVKIIMILIGLICFFCSLVA